MRTDLKHECIKLLKEAIKAKPKCNELKMEAWFQDSIQLDSNYNSEFPKKDEAFDEEELQAFCFT